MQGLIVLLLLNSVSLIYMRAWKSRWWYLLQRSRQAKKLGWGHTPGETALVVNLGQLLPCPPPHRGRNGQSPEMRTLPMESLNSTFLTKAEIANGAKIKNPLPCSPAQWLSQNHFRREWWRSDGPLNAWYFLKVCSEPSEEQHRQGWVEVGPEHILPSLYWSHRTASEYNPLPQQPPGIQ